MLNRRQLIASGAGIALAGSLKRAQAQDTAVQDVSSVRYISTNADTGAVFAAQGAHDQVAIASLTKIFTATEAIHLAPLDTVITTTADDFQPAEATVMGFGAGEPFTLEELIYGMLLPSGNDAAYAIARSLGHQDGDSAEEAVQRFMDLVNQRVLAMGLQNTHLLNPDGWGVEGHYSSAADVAAFMAYACQSDFLLQVMGTQSYTASGGYQLTNTNRTLTTAPSVLGGKTGYDDDAGYCLVQIAEREGTRIIAVNLDGPAPDIWYNDNLLLLDYGFDTQAALGNNQFDGEFLAWSDPAPALFAEVSTDAASIVGETTESEEVAITEEVDLPNELEAEAEITKAVISLEKPNGDGILAGIGATILAGTMAVSRWTSLGGDGSAESIRAGVSAVTASLGRAVPRIPGVGSSRDEDVFTSDTEYPDPSEIHPEQLTDSDEDGPAR